MSRRTGSPNKVSVCLHEHESQIVCATLTEDQWRLGAAGDHEAQTGEDRLWQQRLNLPASTTHPDTSLLPTPSQLHKSPH